MKNWIVEENNEMPFAEFVENFEANCQDSTLLLSHYPSIMRQ